MGHKGHFTLCVTGIKTALGTAQALNPLSGESAQSSRTVAGYSLKLMLFSTAGPFTGFEGKGWDGRCGCWGCKVFPANEGSWEQRQEEPEPACSRDRGRAGTQHSSSWAVIEQHLGTAEDPVMEDELQEHRKGGKCSGKLLKLYGEADL